ncbi:Nn.00g035750.m01.CDS01 [Neocucurbitaria sp. VM-36]
MALKRKSLSDADIVPQKKSRIDPAEDALDVGSTSDESGDYKINYTDTGERRAESEARRQWNYVCPVEGCAQRFNRPCRLESHMRSHNKERPFACTEPGCDKTFPRKDHLQRHLKNAHSDPVVERTYVCDWKGCGKSFTSNGRLQRHRDVHETKYYCTDYPPCYEAFRKEKALAAHIKSQHLEVKPYSCTFVDAETGDRCTSGFQTEGALQRHINKVHSNGQDEGHFCMLCTSPGADLETIQTESGETITIPIQPLSFASNEELLAHTEECHPAICSECGQKFKNASTLKTHVDNVHADPAEQPQFPCPKPDCDSVFNRKHNLTVHIQTVHDKQFKFFCTSDALQNSKHEDLKNWNGENACGAPFKAKSSLDQHVRTHHLGLGNRKQLRKAAKSKKKPDPSMLTLLTGVGYEKGREVLCLVKTCEYRFYMDRDLRRHLRAAHNIPEDEVEEMIQERDAMTGGQFWIGGLDESMNMFESTEPSMPQTPAPFFTDDGVPLMSNVDGQPKSIHPHFGFFDQQFDHLSLLNEEAEMDMAMGLANLAPASNVQEGLQWEMLAPVEQYNMGNAQG